LIISPPTAPQPNPSPETSIPVLPSRRFSIVFLPRLAWRSRPLLSDRAIELA
jgi:hypothetical protein